MKAWVFTHCNVSNLDGLDRENYGEEILNAPKIYRSFAKALDASEKFTNKLRDDLIGSKFSLPPSWARNGKAWEAKLNQFDVTMRITEVRIQ